MRTGLKAHSMGESGTSSMMSGEIENSQRHGQNMVLIILLVLLALGGGGSAYYYRQRFEEAKKNPQKIVQDEVSAVVSKVNELMILPADEQPTLATVTDPTKLQDQPFFAKAKVGDKLLLYATARKAILYDPIANKIVEVAPINIGNP